MMEASDHVLQVEKLVAGFATRSGYLRAVDGISFHVDRGESVALVGESGSGKSVTALSIMRLLSPPGRILGGEVRFHGENLLSLPEKEMRAHRGNDIAMIFQEPMTSLNPVFTIGAQVVEALRVHRDLSKKDAWSRAGELLDLVAIPDPGRRLHEYPHQLSGGMRQRTMIAMALACDPEILIADEPTTALDVTIQAQILELLADLREKLGLAILLITHDLGIVAGFCSRALVMYAGKIVEESPVEPLFVSPAHPYTRGLLASVPRLRGIEERLEAIPGTVPQIDSLPSGCRFHPRCGDVMDVCRRSDPPAYAVGPGRTARCYLHEERSER